MHDCHLQSQIIGSPVYLYRCVCVWLGSTIPHLFLAPLTWLMWGENQLSLISALWKGVLLVKSDYNIWVQTDGSSRLTWMPHESVASLWFSPQHYHQQQSHLFYIPLGKEYFDPKKQSETLKVLSINIIRLKTCANLSLSTGFSQAYYSTTLMGIRTYGIKFSNWGEEGETFSNSHRSTRKCASEINLYKIQRFCQQDCWIGAHTWQALLKILN